MSCATKKYSIYKITNKINGKVYIGKNESTNPIYRWKRHINESKTPNVKTYIHRAMAVSGVENFNFEVILECKNSEYLCKYEIYLISQYNSTDEQIGYNLTKGGKGGRKI